MRTQDVTNDIFYEMKRWTIKFVSKISMWTQRMCFLF